MRLNRGTLILLAISLIVIVGAYLLTSNQANQAVQVSPTPAGGGPLFPDVTADSVTGLTVSDNISGAFTRLARESADADWTITGPEDAADRELDLEAVASAVNNAVSLAAESQFDVEQLAEFGLDSPTFTIEIETGAALNIVLVGGPNPGETRYYVQRRQVAVDETGAPDTEVSNAVYLVMSSAVTQLTNLIASPPYLPLPTATPTPTATLNPLSEVEQATATAEAQLTATSIFATLAADSTATAAAEITEEVTEEPTE